jgi:23S rRNA (cytosine1962-C5)-methyltransferase
MLSNKLLLMLETSLQCRSDFMEDAHTSAFRVFNGFLEGFPDLVVDIYARTLVISNYAANPATVVPLLSKIQELYLERLPWLKCVIIKTRNAQNQSERNGLITFGQIPDRCICEHGILYSLDLTLHQDSSFYHDTRNLRQWLLGHTQGWTVLNTFAYTGSLGIACLAGGVQRVIQVDRNVKFLSVAKESTRLNNVPVHQKDFLVEDFFTTASRFRHSPQLFDCVIVDPPFFSQTSQGTVDLQKQFQQVINKVRPLVKDGGILITINNSLFVSGAEYIHQLEQLGRDGYLSISEFIGVPQDCIGYPQTLIGNPPSDPTPFNHSTKIAVLYVRRK